MSEKNRMIFNLMEDWIRLYRKNICIVPYLKMQKVSSVAIYGYGRIGRLIAEELEESDIEVKYMIDQNAESFKYNGKIPIMKYDDIFEKVDIVLVTAAIEEESKQIAKKVRDEKGMDALPFHDVLVEMKWYLE